MTQERTPGLPEEVRVLEGLQAMQDARRAPTGGGRSILPALAVPIGGQGLEAGVSQRIVRTGALEAAPDSHRGPQGL